MIPFILTTLVLGGLLKISLVTVNNLIKIENLNAARNSGWIKEYSYSIIWITGEARAILIDNVIHENITNTMFFLYPKCQWKFLTDNSDGLQGYVLHLSENILNDPLLTQLPITHIRILHPYLCNEAKIDPDLKKQLESILSLMDGLIKTNLNRREEAIRALNQAFLILCDPHWKIKPSYPQHDNKAVLVSKFMGKVNEYVTEIHDVRQYAMKLHVSSAYLNECTHSVLGANAKSLIIDQLVIRATEALKFSDKSSKEIAYDLGFSSPDYFSSFCKKHTGHWPKEFKKYPGVLNSNFLPGKSHLKAEWPT